MAEMMNEEGSYKPESGDFDDMKAKPEAQLSINPKTIEGIGDYRPGDTVMLHLKVKWPKDAQMGQGMTEVDVISARAMEMDGSMRMTRQRSEAGTY